VIQLNCIATYWWRKVRLAKNVELCLKTVQIMRYIQKMDKKSVCILELKLR